MDKKKLVIIYIVTFVLACCNLLYELLIAQTIVSLAANTVVWYSLTVGIYLLAMGLGAMNCRHLQKQNSDAGMLFKAEIYLSMAGALCVLMIHFGHMLLTYFIVRNMAPVGVSIFFGIAFCMAFLIGFISGLELPLLISIGNTLSKQPVINRILSADYFGSLVAAVLFPLVLVPHVDLIAIGFGVAFVNIITAAVIVFIFSESVIARPLGRSNLKDFGLLRFARNDIRWLKIGLIIILIAIGIWKTPVIEQYFLQKYYYYPESTVDLKTLLSPPKDLPTIEHHQSLYQEIDFVRYPDRGDPFYQLVQMYNRKPLHQEAVGKDYLLYLDKSLQFWFNFEEIYHEYFAHVPVAANGRIPENVLVLGAGDGLLIRELVKYPAIKRITLVELDGKMIDLARHHPLLTAMNQNALEDGRVNIVVGDAFHYLRQHQEQFDAIYIDFPDPKTYDLSKLFSFEFYHFIKNHLKDTGFAVFNAPRLSAVNEEKVHLLLTQTLKRAGFETIIPFSSRLEIDHPPARAFLSVMLGDASEMRSTQEKLFQNESAQTIQGKEEMITQILTDFTDDYQQNFFMIKKTPLTINPQAPLADISLNVLNSHRLQLTLTQAAHQDFTFEKVKGRTNSIFHPQLPDFSYWWWPNLPF